MYQFSNMCSFFVVKLMIAIENNNTDKFIKTEKAMLIYVFIANLQL